MVLVCIDRWMFICGKVLCIIMIKSGLDIIRVLGFILIIGFKLCRKVFSLELWGVIFIII